MHQRVFGNIVDGLDTKASIGKRKYEGERTEIVALRKIQAHGTRHVPKIAMAVRNGFFIGEEVRIALKRNAESLGENIVAIRR